jgi:hypothetical protein
MLPVVICLLLSVAAVSGQAIDGELAGSVFDQSGAAIVGAEVKAVNQDTGVGYRAMSDSTGAYRISHAPIGPYEVEAASAKFATQRVTGVRVQLNRTTTLSFDLEVQAQTATVQVREAAPPIDAMSAQTQLTLEAQPMIDIPNATAGTGFLNLSLLSANVTTSSGLGNGVGPSVGGQRPAGNRFNIEGINNSSYYVAGPLAYVSSEALAEFTLLQNHFSAEHGFAVGGVFNAVVKSGGNQVHGSAYEYMQNRNLNAIDGLSKAAGVKQNSRLDSNRFGGTIGGPILKNRLFYFGNFEYSPTGFATTSSGAVVGPTAEGYRVLNSIAGLNKTNLGIMQQYVPAAAVATDSTVVSGQTVPVGLLNLVAPVYVNATRAVGAVDWHIGERDSARGRYILSKSEGIDSRATLPVFWGKSPSTTHEASISELHTFNASALNELRVSYARNNNRRSAPDFSFPGLDSFPTLFLGETGITMGPTQTVPNGSIQGEFQATDSVSVTRGRHAMKVGYDFRDAIISASNVSSPRGYYLYSSLERYLQDLKPDLSGTRGIGRSGINLGGWPGGFLMNAAYYQDDFRVRPNLTLNLGVRYEFVTVPVMSRAQGLASIADAPGVIVFREPQPRKTDWSPRVGFAWSPGRNGLWSVRGGFSRSFDLPNVNIAANTAPVFYGTSLSVNSATPLSNFLATGGLTQPSTALDTTAGARANTGGFTPDQDRPYAINYTLSVQRTLGKDYTVEARYLGTKGVHLYMQNQLNRVAQVTPTKFIPTFVTMPTAAQISGLQYTLADFPAANSNPWTSLGFSNAITAYLPRGNSRYNGLSLQLNKRYSKGFSYLASYTWSRTMDDSTATTATTTLIARRPQDFNNNAAEWAASLLDRRQRFTLTPAYDWTPFRGRNWVLKNVLGNWNAALTYSYESPAFVTPQSNVDANANGDAVGDRTVVNPAGTWNVGSAVTAYDRNGNALSSATTATAFYVAKNPNARYIQAQRGALATGGRTTFPMQPVNNFDLGIRKRINLMEQKQVEIGAYFYNLFNHAQYTGGYTNDVSPNRTDTSINFMNPSLASFGRYDQFFTSNPRQIQLVARITF